MFTAVLGPWASRIKFHGSDNTLGCWSFLELEGKTVKRFIFITGYRPCSQPPKLGANMCYDQQYRLLTKLGHFNPDPPNQFIEDLLIQIKEWHRQGKAVLISLDANKDVQKLTKTQGIGWLSAKTDMADLHHYRYPNWPQQATHNQGSHPINVCYDSPEFLPVLCRAMLLPFGLPELLTGDHWTIITDFDTTILFGSMTQQI